MTITHHPDVPIGQHIDIDGHHYVISVHVWPLSHGYTSTRVYRADTDGTVRYGQCVAEWDGAVPDAAIQQLADHHAKEGAS